MKTFMGTALVCAVLSMAFSPLSHAQDDYNEGKNLSSYTVTRTTAKLKIDGKINEADWKRAEEFVMVEATKGGKAPLKTTMRLLWDDDFLYIAYFCEDPDAWATWEKEDDPMWDEEVVEFFIDPNGTGFSYYEHEINPINQKVDLFIVNAGKRLNGKFTGWKDWDFKNLKQAVYVDGDGKKHGTKDKFWTVEVAVPFDELLELRGNTPEDGDMWRFNAYRIERGDKNKKDDDFYAGFSPVYRGSFHTPWQFGKIYFKK